MGENASWDVIVVGGGVAGLSAALMLGRALRRVLVIDAGEPRNRFAAHMHGVLGSDGLDPAALRSKGRAEAGAYGVEFLDGTVDSAHAGDRTATVTTGGRELTARALIVATGLADDLPDVPGLAERWGTSVLHCPYCHGWELRARRLGVLGCSPSSLHQAELMRQWTDTLTYFCAGCETPDEEMLRRLGARDVEVVHEPVDEVLGEGDRLAGVRLADGREVPLDALFVSPMPRPLDDFLGGLELERKDNDMGSFLATDSVGQTSHPRIWAVGNVVNAGANVPISIGAGAMVASIVNTALVSEEYDDAVAAVGRRP